MSDTKLPILPKAPVEGIRIHVARAGLVIGDIAALDRLPDGRIGVYARVRQRFLGLIPRRRTMLIGHLGPVAEDLLSPALSNGDPMRIRIIDLTPEHLANGFPPEIYISVWGDPRHFTERSAIHEAFLPLPVATPEPEELAPRRAPRFRIA
ncbi:MAG: hypothetical protein U1E06_08065 [Tabrizicola sp.]|uniref:hypothetical protein n=1 Tax=Tabrizicola sp. TaxID=2005166 RepID=UPI0027344DB3|nr:hypothetical protein [Tabrizicola sp.]MDP3262672.1 hypothetical protein [Tabrizicola sp.]MDP3647351.1 hypothetical protein [Paracoccaceae bacterium]MDZ4066798.1 hypothetical protein [Tabrizicola sp.]